MKRSGTATVIVLNVQIVCSFICTIVSSQKCNWSRTDRTGIAIHKSLVAIFSADLGLCINYNIFNRRIVTSNPMEPCLSFRLSNFTETGIKISYKNFSIISDLVPTFTMYLANMFNDFQWVMRFEVRGSTH